MVEILLFFLLPAVTLVLARRRSGLRPAAIALAEYMIYAISLFVITMLFMVPLDRVTVRFVYYNYKVPHITYGSAAILFEAALSVLLGVGMAWYKKRYVTEGAEPRGRESMAARAAHAFGGALIFVMLLLTFSYMWARENYGNISFAEVVFYINMPLEGTDSSFWSSILKEAVLPACLAFLPLALLMYWPSRRAWWVRSKHRGVWLRAFPLRTPLIMPVILSALWLYAMYGFADREFHITSYIEKQMQQSSFIADEYVDPKDVTITFPEKKRNLITVYIESAETSSQDKENGGFFDVNYIPEMTALAKEYVSFSHSDKLEGAAVAPATGWTIAGLVAQTAGLPLKLFRYEDGDGTDNSMNRFAYFMPGATTLGDLLEAEGYRNVFMAGSDFTFGGRRAYYTQHGNYEVYDYIQAKEQGIIPQDYKETWGFEDRKLYAWAKDVITELAAGDQPFNFSMITVDTHAPDGYTCPICPEAEGEFAFEAPLRCSSKQIGEFIDWCRTQPFFEDTTIVVTGDHSSMVAFFYGDVWYEKHTGDTGRKIYNVFINAEAEPVKENGRLFTTMDFFPTTLAAMGVEIEGDRLGLGTNLFSEKETLAEKYGYEVMFEQMDRKSTFYNNKILYP